MVADRPQRSDAELVRAASNDDATAFGELFERWFDRVFDVARNIVRNDDTAAEVAQDVFLTTWQRLDQLDDPERFGGWLLRASRNRALNRLEKERRAQPLDGAVMTGLHEGLHGGEADRDDLVGSNRMLETEAISDSRNQQSLVWAAAAALGPRDLSLLDLQLRHQLSPAEIADELDLTANNAHQLLFRLRSKLGDAVANHLLWRGGSPRCDELSALVDGDPFDASVNKIVQRHSARCETCGPERERVVDPTKLFAAAPIAIAPLFLRYRAAAALTADGVPLANPDGSTSTESATSGDETEPPSGDSQSGDSQSGDSASGGSQSGDSASGDSSVLAAAAPEASPPRRWRRRLGFCVVVVASVVGLALTFTRPAGELDLAIEPGSSSTESPADSSGEPEQSIALPSTSTSPPTDPPIVTSPPTDPPIVTSPPTDPPVVTSPPTDPPNGTSPPTDPPVVTPPPPPPVIVRFTLSVPAGAIFCLDPTDTARTAQWFTEEATGVTLTTPGGSTSFDPSDSHTFCAPARSIITLTATGPGGTASDTETIS